VRIIKLTAEIAIKNWRKHGRSQSVIKKLDSLEGKQPTIEQAERAIGDDNWTTLLCEECGDKTHEGIVLECGDAVVLCRGCIRKAEEMFSKGRKSHCKWKDLEVVGGKGWLTSCGDRYERAYCNFDYCPFCGGELRAER
jgi:hypothetical protein